MTYQITFRNKTTLSVDEEQGETIKRIIMSGKNIPFEIDDNVYRTVDIASLEKSHDTPLPPVEAYISSGPSCRSKRSVQNEINHIIMDEYKNWSSVIRDEKTREHIRASLRELDNGWCDYKEDECIC
jgi:hypothetical protein